MSSEYIEDSKSSICATCSSAFKPNRSWQVYCSPTCQSRRPSRALETKTFQAGRRQKINHIKLSAGCSRCGYSEHPAALDFNHIPERGPKKFNISQDPKRKWSSILHEIAKCEVLCANCHRIHTYENKHWHTLRKETL